MGLNVLPRQTTHLQMTHIGWAEKDPGVIGFTQKSLVNKLCCGHTFDRSNCHPNNSWLFPNIFNVMRLVGTFNKSFAGLENSFNFSPIRLYSSIKQRA